MVLRQTELTNSKRACTHQTSNTFPLVCGEAKYGIPYCTALLSLHSSARHEPYEVMGTCVKSHTLNMDFSAKVVG